MLGFGHTPKARAGGDGQAAGDGQHHDAEPVAAALRRARCAREVGHTRGGCPYSKFLCLNSGSESVSLASPHRRRQRQADDRRRRRHAGRTIKRLAVKGAFHGRTERPALYSDSSRKTYMQHLASFRDEDSLLTVEPYNVEQLQQVFADADTQRLVHRGDVPGAGDGRRRSGPRGAAGVLRRRARTDARRTARCCWSTRSRPACARTACCRSSIIPASKNSKRRTWKPIPRRSTPASIRCRCSR